MNLETLTAAMTKLFSSLKTRKKRDENRLFIAEGENLCYELLNSSYKVKTLLIRQDASSTSKDLAKLFERKKTPVYSVNEKLLKKISDTVSPQDLIAIVNYKDDKPIQEESFIALDQISDPGNIGTIIRTAEWFGFKQIIMSENCADKYNPKLVRSAMGSLFRMKIITELKLSQSLKIIFPHHLILGASLEAKKTIDRFKPNRKFGLIFGNESHGISEMTKNILDDTFKIPGYSAESLNVAVAAGISFYYFTSENSD